MKHQRHYTCCKALYDISVAISVTIVVLFRFVTFVQIELCNFFLSLYERSWMSTMTTT